MATINQQPIPKPFIEIFEKAGIAVKQFDSVESFEEDLMEFLNRNNVLHLSTCKDDTARATPLEYRMDGMTFCILSAGGVKFDYIKNNNTVSFSIAEPYDSEGDFWSYKGLQAWGTAEVISKKENPDEFNELIDKMGIMKVIKQLGITELRPEMNYRIIKITPDRIKYNNPRAGVFRVSWERE
ncbi:pyridoxamine 5'-phosphate oxidase family protein [Spirochaetota bacterium]